MSQATRDAMTDSLDDMSDSIDLDTTSESVDVVGILEAPRAEEESRRAEQRLAGEEQFGEGRSAAGGGRRAAEEQRVTATLRLHFDADDAMDHASLDLDAEPRDDNPMRMRARTPEDRIAAVAIVSHASRLARALTACFTAQNRGLAADINDGEIADGARLMTAVHAAEENNVAIARLQPLVRMETQLEPHRLADALDALSRGTMLAMRLLANDGPQDDAPEHDFTEAGMPELGQRPPPPRGGRGLLLNLLAVMATGRATPGAMALVGGMVGGMVGQLQDVPTPLSPELSEAIPCVTLRDAPPVSNTECNVCMENLQPADTVRVFACCNMAHHAECLTRWFREHDTCLVCRVKLADILQSRDSPPSDGTPTANAGR